MVILTYKEVFDGMYSIGENLLLLLYDSLGNLC